MTDPIAWRRPFAAPIKRFQVLGERSSGTNFVDVLFKRNTTLQPTKDYGWKHAVPQFTSVLRDDLIIVCFRGPESWLRSMYAKPWHVPDSLVNVTFSEFLRAPWVTVMDMPGAMSAVGARKSLDLPVQGDRHPITGMHLENPVQLRNLKNAAFLGVLERGCNVALIRHEDVTRYPRETISKVCELFDIPVNAADDFVIPTRQLGEMTQRNVEGSRRDKVATYSDDDRAFVFSQLDHDLETKLGYGFSI
ncbi:hypothetical protein [Paracoccus sp. PAR01]|uniref:hypothetical protein n=1 Tax=Paracoccus sp. PAR01 TaxID=2769282 RepID=UPI0017846671|nr:hypothetical protein [Paracoccus sp. PAR01]MBD9528239.1 hypothetical protein [Paracoccus sp. PAR01]